jgi:hypothetical protein
MSVFLALLETREQLQAAITESLVNINEAAKEVQMIRRGEVHKCPNSLHSSE